MAKVGQYCGKAVNGLIGLTMYTGSLVGQGFSEMAGGSGNALGIESWTEAAERKMATRAQGERGAFVVAYDGDVEVALKLQELCHSIDPALATVMDQAINDAKAANPDRWSTAEA